MAGKNCVLAVDTSGSVSSSELYWNKINELLKKTTADKNYTHFTIIAWNTNFEHIQLEELQSLIERRYGSGGTQPAFVWDCLSELQLTNYDLHLTTDGQIWHGEYQSYCDKYKSLHVKPDHVTMYYIGTLVHMNMQFLDCFGTVDYEIHGLDSDGALVDYASKKIGKNFLLDQLCEIDEFKQIKEQTIATDDETAITNALENLYKKLYRKMAEYSESEMNEGGVGIEFKKFVDLVNKYVHCNYINVATKDEVSIIDELFEDYHANSTKIFNVFVKQFEAATLIDYRKVLSRIMELGNGQSKVDRRLQAYGDNWHARASATLGPSDATLDYDDEMDGENDDATADTDASESCPILMLNSTEYNKFCVAWIGSDDSFGGDGHKEFFDSDVRRKLAKNAMRLYQYLSSDKLNKRIPPANQHISIDAFIGLQELENLNAVGAQRFKRIYKSPLHMVNCFGIILYNADTKYEWPEGKMTEQEKNVYLHNYATIAQLLFGDSKFIGSFPLLFTFFLNILYNCGDCDSYVKACIMKTLQRSTAISKCNLMIESGIDPKINTTVKNAIIFHTQIYPHEVEKMGKRVVGINALNIPRKCIQYCSEFLKLATRLYAVSYSVDYNRKLALWRFWNYMLCIENMSHNQKMMHFKQIALSKNQKWVRITDDADDSHIKLMFIEGPSDGAYFDYLNDIDFVDLVKLIVLFEITKVKTLTMNISLDGVVLAEKAASNDKNQWYHIRVIDRYPRATCNMVDNIPFCKARCGYPAICPYTKLPQMQCYENQKFNLCDYGYPDTSSTQFAHSYVQKCKQLIWMKSADEKEMKLPSVDELKKFIVKKTPLVTHHAHIDYYLKKFIEKYQAWYDWYVNCDENEKNKYLFINRDWKKIFCFQKQADGIIEKQLANCDCPAHHVN